MSNVKPTTFKSPIRIMLFIDRPDCMLVHMPPDVTDAGLPPMSVPLSKDAIRAACKDAGIDVRVTVGPSGRWTKAALTLRSAERAERRQRMILHDASHASIMQGSNVTMIRERAEAVRKKLEIDESLRSLRAQRDAAKSNAHERGQYMPASEYRALERRITALSNESQALQLRLSELKREEKQANIRRSNGTADRFVRLAREALDQETFDALMDEAQADDDPPSDRVPTPV